MFLVGFRSKNPNLTKIFPDFQIFRFPYYKRNIDMQTHLIAKYSRHYLLIKGITLQQQNFEIYPY